MARRSVLGGMAAAGLGYALFGPRGAKEESGGRLVLDYWEKWSGHEAAAMQQVVDAFNDSQDRIFVRFFTMTAIDQKAMVAIAGGDPPDIIGLYNKSVAPFAESKAIVAVDELAESAGIRREHYAAPVWEMLKFGGRTWGLPNTCSTIGFFWDRRMFRDAGLNPDVGPRTIEELDEVARRLTIIEPDGTLSRMGFVQTEPGWWPYCWGPQFGGRLYDPETDRATPMDPRVVRGFEWVQSYPEGYGLDVIRRFGGGFGNYDSPLQPLLAGKVAMCQHGPFLVNVIKRYKPDFDYGASAFPVPEDIYDERSPRGILEADILVIPQGSRRPEASMEFIAFTQRREWVEHMARAHCKPSPLAESGREFLASHPHRYIAEHERIVRSPGAYSVPKTRTWSEYEEEIRSAFNRIWDQGQPVERVLASIGERINLRLDQARERRERRARLAGDA